MTKKDYKTLAVAYGPYYELASDDIEKHALIMSMITATMKAIKKDNPNFDSIKFLDIMRNYKK